MSEANHKPDLPAPLRLRVTSDPHFIAPVRRAVEHFCTEAGFDENSVGDLGLCMNESMANVTRHAYEGDHNKPMEVEAEFDGKAVCLKVRDWGPGHEPPVEPHHDPLKPGGIGLVCLKKLLDEFKFTKQPDGMLLTMKRKLSHGRAS